MSEASAFSVPHSCAMARGLLVERQRRAAFAAGGSAALEETEMSDTFNQDARQDDDAPQVEITPKRLDELIRWHGTDESALPPAHTLQHLSRDTVAALAERARDRETIARLRAAMARAFWAAERRELNAILLEALGPPPEPPEEGAPGGSREGAGREASDASAASRKRSAPTRLDADVARGLHRPGAARALSRRVS
ncbi:MAG: hypothetical protein ACREUT_06325 [Steroidobacteraceae bacterium]